MSMFPIGRRPVFAFRSVLAPLAASAAAFAAAGCATDKDNAYYAGSAYAAYAPPAHVAPAPAVEMEADGLPVQAAPSARIRSMPDDPAEPFSPNYGGANPANASVEPATVNAANETDAPRAIPADLPPPFRRQLVAAVETAG